MDLLRRFRGSMIIPVALVALLIALGVIGYFFVYRAKYSAPYNFDQGKWLYNRNKIDKAIVLLERARKIDPKHKEASLLLSHSYLKKADECADLSRRLAYLKQSFELVGGLTDLPITEKMSDTYLAMVDTTNNLDQKFEFLSKARQLATGERVLIILKRTKQVADEIGEYNFVINTLEPYYAQQQSPELKELLVQTYLAAAEKTGNVQDKIVMLKKLRSIDPENTESAQTLALAQVEMASEMDSFEVVVSMCEQALALDANCQAAKEKLVDLYVGEAEKTLDATEKKQWYERAKAIMPDSARIVETNAWVSLEGIAAIKDVHERIAALQEALKRKPEPEAYYLIAMAHGEVGDHLTKISKLEELLALTPDYREATLALAQTYFQLGLDSEIPDEKIRWYTKSLEYNDQDIQALHNLGLVLQNKGLFDKAIDRYLAVIAIDMKFAPSYLNMGWLYWKKKQDVPKSLDAFRQYVRLKPSGATSQKVKRYIEHLEKEIRLKGMIRTD